MKPLKHVMGMGPLPATLETLLRDEVNLDAFDGDERIRPGYLCAVVRANEIGMKIAGWRADPLHHATPVIAVVDEPDENAYLNALVGGADDLLLSSDRHGALRRLQLLGDREPGPKERRGSVVLIDPDHARRVRLGRPLFRSGLSVEFACSIDELPDHPVDVVVVHESSVEADPHHVIRAKLRADDLPVVLIVEPGEVADAGPRMERTARIPADAPADHLLFVINELLNPGAEELRASPRLLHASLCAFRSAGQVQPRYGVTFNVSRGGVFVRTLDLPEAGEIVWLEFKPPGLEAAVHLRGTVAWRTLGGATPPGFAVQLLAHRCPSDDLATYRNRYQWLLDRGAASEEVHDTLDSDPPACGARILVADDEPLMRKQLERIFRGQDIEVTLVSDGREAVEVFRRERHDVVIADIHMPRLDGIGLLKAIRASDEEVPVIVTTGDPALETAIEAVENGALRYLVKPFEAEEVRKMVSDAIGMARLAKFRRQAAMVVASSPAEVDELSDLDETLSRAIDQLFAHYQPIVRWPSREVVAYETLARTKEPKVPHPGVLFDAAERLSRVHEVGRRMRQLAPEPLTDGGDARLFINLHPADLLDEDLYDPESALAALGDRVVLEITERASLDGVRDLRERVDRLRALGFRIAVDDLGAGYAGLSAFCALQPEVVKLDMSLVRDVHLSDTKRRLVRSMTSACEELGIDVIAEGVESLEELETLQELGLELFQGFLFARPGLPFPEIDWPSS